MEYRITPEIIIELQINEIFVFGSNESGIHGAGAARIAFNCFGAKWNLGFGIAGHSFAIPTKDWDVITLSLDNIQFYVDRFLEFVKSNPHLIFYVTKIGCGLAGYEVKDIAPLFKNAINTKNIYLPIEFWNELKLI